MKSLHFTALANEGFIRRSDILVMNTKRNSGLIVDPSITFENCKQQPKLVNEEKRKTCNKIIDYYSEKV